MSSAILYLAIVAIWAVVLVPRWLRPRSAQSADQSSAEPQFAEPQFAEVREPQAAAPPQAEPHPVPQPATARAVDAALPGAAEPRAQPDESVPSAPSVPSVPSAPDEPAAVPAIPPAAARRADILGARRRMLAMIVALTAGAVGLAETGIAASWVIVPPALLLAGFLVLLREAARSDAERMRAARARHAAAYRAADADLAGADVEAAPDQLPATVAASAEVSVATPEPSVAAAEQPTGAEVIDISARMSDQVYDQYSDAAERAVGD